MVNETAPFNKENFINWRDGGEETECALVSRQPGPSRWVPHASHGTHLLIKDEHEMKRALANVKSRVCDEEQRESDENRKMSTSHTT